MKIDKPWGRTPHDKRLKFFRAMDGKIVAPLPAKAVMTKGDEEKLTEIKTPDWMALGDYVVYSTKNGEYAVTAVRDEVPHLWTTEGVDCHGNNAKVMVGPDFDWETCLPRGWIARTVALLRDAERMFPELEWAIEWDAPELRASGSECSQNMKGKDN